jgi:small conductance mechanosensitive channel
MVIGSAEPTEEITSSARSLWESSMDALPRLGVAVLIVLAGWGVGRGVRWLMHARFRRSRTPSFANVISKLTSWIVVFVSALLAAAVTFPSVKPVDLLAGLGFFSVAVGFAFQDILENTLAGVLLLFRQPFRSGDQIDVVGQAGTVTEITIRETRITTFDAVTSAMVEALSAVPGVARDPEPQAVVRELGVASVDIRALLWSDSRQCASVAVLDAAIRAVKHRLERDGVEMPVPSLVLQADPRR